MEIVNTHDKTPWAIKSIPTHIRTAFVGYCAMRGKNVGELLSLVLQHYLEAKGISFIEADEVKKKNTECV